MRHYKNILFIIFLGLCTQLPAKQIMFNDLSPINAATYLNWVPTTVTTSNLCGGYYHQPKIVRNFPVASDLKTTEVTVTATRQVYYAGSGDAVLIGNVTLTQPGRLVSSDKLILHRDTKTGKITSADLIGNVHLREFGKLVVGNKGHINFVAGFMTVDNGIYWLHTPSRTGVVDLTGRLIHIKEDNKNKLLTLKHATYNTCRPDKNIWHFWTSTLKIDRQENVVSAFNPVFFVKDVPVLYFPYLRFSLNKERKTGFLFPSFSSSSDSGYGMSLPFYLNLAPNFDATITPDFMSRRGVLNNGQIRYLSESSSGELDGGYIFNDRAFKKFLNKNRDPNSLNPAIAKLDNDSDNRGYFKFIDQTKFNQYLNANLKLQYVTDDYLINDISMVPSTKNTDQLENNLDLNFANTHWRFLGRAQVYQTLHLINDQGTTDQYSRLPQLDLTGDYPNQWLGMHYKINSEFVDFSHWPDNQSKFIPATQEVTGGRLNLQPSIDWPLNVQGFYLDPRVQVPVTFYELHKQQTGNPSSINRALPIVDIDSGIAFARSISIFGAGYTQTLEPRAMYLYVPVHNQDDIPTFDDTLQSITFDNVFRTNRFSSIDRIGDANQVAVGLTSRFLDADSGFEKLNLGLGEVFAFQQHQVCLSSNCKANYAADPLLTHYVSPLLGKVTYNLNQNWNVTANAAWDVYKEQVNNAAVTFQFLSNKDHVINLSYNYEADGDINNGKRIDLNRVDASAAWVVFHHWRLMGQINYDFGTSRPLSYLYGLEYNSCCWAIRGVYDRIRNTDGTLDHAVGVQILLKGIGGVGYNQPSSILTKSISGFNDIFITG